MTPPRHPKNGRMTQMTTTNKATFQKSLRHTALAVLPLAVLLALGGCTNIKPNTDIAKVGDSLSGDYKETDAHLKTAAADAMAGGHTKEALELYKKLHERHKRDMSISIGYAQMLRKTGDAEQAAFLLTPYTLPPADKDGKPVAAPALDPQLANELAADQIALGKFDDAHALLAPMLDAQTENPWRGESANLMGVVLDAQGDHKGAEKLFRVALDGWKGDKTSVMNNLALCLASQGMFDQSLTTLRQALVMSPDNTAIARNIQIVSDLRKNVVPKPPVSLRKK
ncbi:MAG: tetratricopeptide repeat protein [Alphaproteobacteria bacterium]|nr:tetratricopeptide repeat protein [Alphaproteobacteria bacterium]